MLQRNLLVQVFLEILPFLPVIEAQTDKLFLCCRIAEDYLAADDHFRLWQEEISSILEQLTFSIFSRFSEWHGNYICESLGTLTLVSAFRFCQIHLNVDIKM